MIAGHFGPLKIRPKLIRPIRMLRIIQIPIMSNHLQNSVNVLQSTKRKTKPKEGKKDSKTKAKKFFDLFDPLRYYGANNILTAHHLFGSNANLLKPIKKIILISSEPGTGFSIKYLEFQA